LLRRVKKLALPDLSTLLWALAQLQLQPPDDILSELCERTAPYISSCDVTHLTNIVWALGRLQARPDKEWVEAAEAASMQVGGSDTSGGRGQGGEWSRVGGCRHGRMGSGLRQQKLLQCRWVQ
jgi:hypothetical protein